MQGTIRSCSAEETLAWLEPKLADLEITRVANVTGLDHVGIPVVTAIRPNAKHLSVSQGKGASLPLAKVSAVMEAAEAYHVENPPKSDLYGSYCELNERYELLHPGELGCAQFVQKSLGDVPLAWVKAHDLRGGDDVYIPHVLTCIDSTENRPEYGYFDVSSNGLASGNTEEEALCHALYEVIERDALCRWQRLYADEVAEMQLDLESVSDGLCRDLLQRFEEAKLPVCVWEITSSIKVPAFHCAIGDENILRGLGVFTGTGTHFSKDIALSRALTEAAQSRLTLISGSRDDIFPNYYERIGIQNTVHFERGNRLYQNCCTVSYQNDFAENIKQVLEQLQSNGFERSLCVRHTKPILDIPVVQVFVPGLQFNGARM